LRLVGLRRFGLDLGGTVIALCIGLAALSAMLAGFVITMGVWLHSANADRLGAADMIDGQRRLVAEYKAKYDAESVAHTVTSQQLADEQHLRSIAEAQRNEAERRARAYLSKTLTNEELAHVVTQLFATPLSLVPGSELEKPS
jgi:hypothetical protein